MSEPSSIFRQPFGARRPSALVRGMIRCAQGMPRNRFGLLVANLFRSLVTRRGRMPMDVEAEGIRLRCFFRDNYSEKKFVFTPWRFDAKEREYIRNQLPKDGVFIDIGANVGIYSVTALKALGPGGQLVAIEPNPSVHERLVFDLTANGAFGVDGGPVVHTLQVGVSDKHEELELYINARNLGESSLRQGGRALTPDSGNGKSRRGQRPTESIPCRPLLEIIESLSLPRVTGIKIDIEGAEDKALVPYLRSAPEALLARFIVLENSEKAWKLPLIAEMEARGYRQSSRFRMNSIYEREARSTEDARGEGEN
jgi:FkbM family methyltransferase